MTGVAVTAACTACGACLATCPEACILPTGRRRPPLAVADDACTGCLACLEVCPAGAVVPR